MSDNPFEAIRKACDSFGHCFQTHLSRILPAPLENHLSKPSSLSWSSKASFFSFFNASNPSDVNDAGLLAPNVSVLEKKITAAPLTKEELGRAPWTLLHAVAAQSRDYIHIVDLADGHVAALEKLFQDQSIGCEVYNLGTGKGTSVLEMVAEFEKASGKKIPLIMADRRPGDAEIVYASTEKAKQDSKT